MRFLCGLVLCLAACTGPAERPERAPLLWGLKDVPSPTLLAPDHELDGIDNTWDRCPDLPEDPDQYADDDGCPDADNDGDGIPDAKDSHPDVADLPQS